MRIFKVTFEMVSPIAHPQFYDANDVPTLEAELIPDRYWHTVESTGKDILDQYRGLLELMNTGEPIRNVRLYTADEPVWAEISEARTSA